MTKRGMKIAVKNKLTQYHRSVYHVSVAVLNEK